jgi:hypothetical protein
MLWVLAGAAAYIVLVGLILFVPRRHFFHYIGWLLLSAIILATTVDVADPDTFGHALELSIILNATLLAVVAAVGRIVFAKLWRTPRVGGPLSFLERCQALVWGTLIGIGAYWWLTSLFQGLRPSWLAHVLGIAIALVAGVSINLTRRRLLSSDQVAKYAAPALVGRALVWSLGGLVLGSIPAAYYVGSKAEKISGDLPFCVQVAERGGADYQPVSAVLDFSPLVMQSSIRYGVRQQEPALLIRGESAHEILTWDYRGRAFVVKASTELKNPAIYCEPVITFLSDLPAISNGRRSQVAVLISGHQFSFSNDDFVAARGGSLPTITFHLSDPLPPGISSSNDQIRISLTDDEQLQRLFSPAGFDTVHDSFEFGLTKREIRGGGGRWTQYYHAGAEGLVDTLISCPLPSSSGMLCQHRFKAPIGIISFSHDEDSVRLWQQMQEFVLAAVSRVTP